MFTKNSTNEVKIYINNGEYYSINLDTWDRNINGTINKIVRRFGLLPRIRYFAVKDKLMELKRMCEHLESDATYPSNLLEIDKVIFSGPCTIILWKDGIKTISRVQKGDEFDPEKGIAMAIARRVFNNKTYHYIFNDLLEEADRNATWSSCAAENLSSESLEEALQHVVQKFAEGVNSAIKSK